MNTYLKCVTYMACLLGSGALLANTTVYQCSKNGVVHFSQLPCGDDAKVVTVRMSQSLGTPPPQEQVTDNKQNSRNIDAYIFNQQADHEIAEHQDKIDTYTRQMQQELASLQNQSDAQVNNLVGANKDNAIAKEMEAVTERYQALIDREQLNIDRLLAQKTRYEYDNDAPSDSVGEYIRLKEIDRDMRQHLDKIDTLHQRLDAELASVRKQRNSAPQNLVDATFDNAISQQMSAITAKYTTLIDVEQKHVARLSKERSQIANKAYEREAQTNYN